MDLLRDICPSQCKQVTKHVELHTCRLYHCLHQPNCSITIFLHSFFSLSTIISPSSPIFFLPIIFSLSFQVLSSRSYSLFPSTTTLSFQFISLYRLLSLSPAYYLSPASFSITFILSSSQSFFLTLFLLLLQLFLSNSSHSTACCLSLLLSLFLSFFRSSVLFYISFFLYLYFFLSLSLSFLTQFFGKVLSGSFGGGLLPSLYQPSTSSSIFLNLKQISYLEMGLISRGEKEAQFHSRDRPSSNYKNEKSINVIFGSSA